MNLATAEPHHLSEITWHGYDQKYAENT